MRSLVVDPVTGVGLQVVAFVLRSCLGLTAVSLMWLIIEVASFVID